MGTALRGSKMAGFRPALLPEAVDYKLGVVSSTSYTGFEEAL